MQNGEQIAELVIYIFGAKLSKSKLQNWPYLKLAGTKAHTIEQTCNGNVFDTRACARVMHRVCNVNFEINCSMLPNV